MWAPHPLPSLLKLQFVKIIFKHLVPPSKETEHFSIAKIKELVFFKTVIAACSKNYTKQINTILLANRRVSDY
jgi:hypothetical protein